MSTIFTNSGKSNTSASHRQILNLSSKINLKKNDTYLILSDLYK